MVDPSSGTQRCDLTVAGGGPVGLTLALALARRGYEVCVIDGGDPARAEDDSRAFFVAYGCWRIFRALDLEDDLLDTVQPVRSVEAKGRIGGVSFLAEDCESEAVLGYMVEARHLAPALSSAARAAGVRILSGSRIEGIDLRDEAVCIRHAKGEVEASLLAGCDGAKSAVRSAAKLRFEGWSYGAKAISTTVQLDEAHEGAARQIFLPGGPLAVLPLRGDRANLIWSERSAVAEALMELNDGEFEAELAKKAGGFLPGARLAGPRHVFPVGLFVADRFHAPRIALAGDAAHVIHPLAGQGLNLGLKDAAALADIVSDAGRAGLDIGAEAALEPYTAWRRTDVVSTAAAMDAFYRAFSAPLPVRLAAGAAMQAVGSARQARKLFARSAGGDMGDLPTLMARQ